LNTNLQALQHKSVIIFGCGYLGTRFVQLALKSGMAVTALTRNPHTADLLFNAGVDVIAANLQNDSWHELTESTYDFALNCVSSGSSGLDGYRESYVGGLESIGRWLENAQVGTLVYTSSTGVYPQSDGAQVDETATIGGNDRADILAEAEAMLQSMSGHTRHFILRLAGIYGPNRHYLLDLLLSDKKEIQGKSSHVLNITHVDDICTAISKCMLAPNEIENQIYNLSDGNPAAKSDVVNWIASQIGKEAPSFTEHRPNNRLIQARNRIIISQKIRDDLGWEPLYPDYQKGYSSIIQKQG